MRQIANKMLFYEHFKYVTPCNKNHLFISILCVYDSSKSKFNDI